MLVTTDHEAPALVAPELDAGTRLGDRYRLIGRLGAGGGGTVWRAFDEKVAEELALKLVEAGADVERWRREVALARRISHPNVCRVYDLGEGDGRRWVTMELVGGDSLRRVLERGVPAAERERLMRQLVEAVAAIHEAGVVHRDLKPENVVVDGGGRAVIVDFGLAKTPELRDAAVTGDERAGDERAVDPRVTREGAILGTPRYMAPEQAAGRVADARSDVYALGLVLHEIASGGAPGLSEATTVAGGTMAPRAVLPMIPGRWGPVIARCCAEAPADRHADAAAVRAAIAAPRRRSPRRVAVAAAAFAVVAGGAAAAAWTLTRDGERAPRWQPGEVTIRRLTTSTPDRQPMSAILSPDGKRFAYTVHDELYLRDVDGGAPSPVALPRTKNGLPLARLAFALGWASDGRIAVLILDRDDTWSTYLVGGAGAIGPPLYQTSLRPTAAMSPDGTRLAVAVRDRGVMMVPTGGGAATRLTTTSAGEMVGGLAWSPDGTQLALVRYPAEGGGDTLELISADGRESRVLVRGSFANMFDQFVGWAAPDRIVYAATTLGGGAALHALRLRDGEPDGEPVTVMRWPGEYIGNGSVGGGRIALMRGTASYQVFVGELSVRRHIVGMKPALTDGSSGRRLAGWTPGGGVVFAMATAAGDHDIVERTADGTVRPLVAAPADDLPDTIIDGAVIYHRGVASALEVWRHDPAGPAGPARDLHLTTITSDAAAANVVRCAGDRTAPCVIEEVQGDEAIYSRFDPATGARGDVVHRSRLTVRFNRSMGLSPDGAVLALVDNTSTLTTIALATGEVTQREVRRGAELQSVTWSADGSRLWITAFGGGRRLFNLYRLDLDESRAVAEEEHDIRWFWRAQESADGKQIAIQGRDIVLDAWLVEGL